MRILLWGIPCVGHETVGQLLAKKMNYEFIDQNDIIKKKYGTIDKFNELYSINYYRFKIKEDIAFDVINTKNDFVMAMSFIYEEEILLFESLLLNFFSLWNFFLIKDILSSLVGELM